MSRQLTARVSAEINASIATVWDALVNPEVIKQYMFGTTVVSDWKEGSRIVWRGEWQGTRYEDKGTVLRFEPERLVQYSHFSPMSGAPDVPESYHTVTVELSDKGGSTQVTLSQDNNSTEEEREHSEKNWAMMLAGMKELLEK